MAIYKSFRMRFTEAWYQLSQAERDGLLEKVGAALDEAGGKTVVICDAAWAGEQYAAFGMEKFPDLEAVQKHTQLLQELDWFRYIDGESQLGTAWGA